MSSETTLFTCENCGDPEATPAYGRRICTSCVASELERSQDGLESIDSTGILTGNSDLESVANADYAGENRTDRLPIYPLPSDLPDLHGGQS